MPQSSRRLDLHRIAEERSIAYHRVIAQRLLLDGSLLEIARARVQSWLEGGHPIPEYARAWSEILAQDMGTIAGSLIDSSERGRELRQSSPFAGCLSAQERWRLWREVRSLIEQTDDT